MYYYLSFLRPPPTSSPITSPVTITPQIANDLRTEILEDTPIPLLYQWILLPSSTPSSSAQPSFQQQQRPLPLTTFLAPASSYKPLSIPPPIGVQANQTWALAVWATPALNLSPSPAQHLASQQPGWEMNLLDLVSSGRSPCLSVVSEGVRFLGGSGKPTGAGGGGREGKKGTSKPVKGKGAGGGGKDVGEKQDRIKRVFVLPQIPGGREAGQEARKVELTEQTSFDLDKKIWDSGLALSSYLAQHPCPPFSSPSLSEDASRFPSGQPPLQRVLDLLKSASGRELRILELGTGIGLVSLMLASILPTPPSTPVPPPTSEESPADTPTPLRRHSFYATDLPSALPLIDQNLAANSALFSQQATIVARELDWDAPSLPSWVYGEDESEPARPLDLIIMADVTYNSSIFPSLVRTLVALLSRPVTPLVLLSFKERDPTKAERELWTLAAEAGIWFERVGGLDGHGVSKEEGEVEVWVGGMGER